MSQSVSGTHPIDTEVGDSSLFAWVVPTGLIAARNILPALPSIVIMSTLLLTAQYWIPMLPQPRGELTAFIYQFLATVVSSAVLTLGYVLLVHKEGLPYGVGQVASLGSMTGRLLAMLAIWAVGSWLLGRLLGEIIGSRPVMSMLQSPVGWLLMKVGFLNTAFILFWLISPLFVLLSTLSILCNVLCIRTEMSIGEIFSVVFGRVFGQYGRLFLSGIVMSAVLLLMLRALIEAGLNLPSILRYPSVLVCVMLTVLIPLVLAWWFVLERAWVAEAGVEDSVLEEREKAEATPQVTAAQLLAADRAQLIALRDAGKHDEAADYFAQLLRERQRSLPDIQALLEPIGGRWEALAPHLGPLVAMLARNNRSFEAVELTRYALARDSAFLADQPDAVPAFAKRLAQTEQADLAMRLLATYVRQHRGHEGFLGAGLLLARLLMTHGNQPDAARKLLTHLKTLHPQEPQIDMLLRQLG